MMSEIEIIECPICMDRIEEEKNRITTECGHCFHASCLMTNVAHNGFGCPYCRTAMTAEVASVNSDEEYDDFSFDSQEEEGPDYNDHVLRGARWMFQRAEGEEVDDSDESESESESESDDERVEVQARPTVDYIVERLVQRGVSMEDMVKSLLLRDHEEYRFHDEFERGDGELFGKLRIIISNFRPQPAPVVQAQVAEVVLEEGEVEEDKADDALTSFQRFNQYCDSYYQRKRESHYEKMSDDSVTSEFGVGSKTALIHFPEEKKPAFSFQTKGPCRHQFC
jgi:hypothetical protein